MTLADKRVIEADVSLAHIRILEREGVFQIAIIDIPKPLIGVSTFEGLGVKVDPITGKLGYFRPYGLGLL